MSQIGPYVSVIACVTDRRDDTLNEIKMTRDAIKINWSVQTFRSNWCFMLLMLLLCPLRPVAVVRILLLFVLFVVTALNVSSVGL